MTALPAKQYAAARLTFWYQDHNGAVTHAVERPFEAATTGQPLPQLSPAQLQQCQAVLTEWPELAISRCNHFAAASPLTGRYVLAVLGAGPLEQLQQWLQQMLAAQHTAEPLVVWLEPEAEPHRHALQQQFAMLHWVAAGQHAAAWLQGCQRVQVANSQLGFEALLWGKPVQALNPQCYTEQGLTDDLYLSDVPAAPQAPVAEQGARQQRLLQLIGWLFFQPECQLSYPEQSDDASVLATLRWLSVQRQQHHRFPPELQAYRFSRLWRPVLKRFVQRSRLRFVQQAASVVPEQPVLCWGRRSNAYNLPAGTNIISIEDGFLRSVGLGAEFASPVSWIFDHSGMYFDATGPSDLEQLLRQHRFSPALIARAEALIERILSLGMTKYNVGQSDWQRPAHARVILVPGQVETDASIQYGSPVVKRNIDLLKAVRAAEPDAYVIYKPHPDVVAGARATGEHEDDASHYCDAIVLDASMATMLPQIDEVHTITSLTGFEALLRQKKVVCYGQPFYAGWGLTTDHYPPERRQRPLQLAELVAATLILYPVYISRETGYYTSPEQTLNELNRWRQQDKPVPYLWLKKTARQLIEWVKHRGRR